MGAIKQELKYRTLPCLPSRGFEEAAVMPHLRRRDNLNVFLRGTFSRTLLPTRCLLNTPHVDGG
ncbi:unnamed protein product [Ectocarpus sp. CCAP 1310/34]|nr:unnamed protein product [Ectocarpus sp. CCAP 1310/34]